MTCRLLALTLITLTTLPTHAGQIYVGDFKITGTGLLVPGTLTRTFGGRDLRQLSWALLVLGTLVSSGSIGSERETAPAATNETWAHLVREAKIFKRHPELIGDEHEIRAAAHVLHLEPTELAELVVTLHKTPDVARAIERYFPGGFRDESQSKAFQTLVALAHAG